ncbi:hypothetical protein MOV08_24075 [Streptomyces yunnanensis]|uniref:Serine/threonine protein kinase n=1 Tax=Streptomyces yunnanensis TaxID=156453 RepID=A0ABY8AAM4_9ACTN|nr:hypothetical protein [Streptomyces yunnanensis]WEB42037.1 hypothetical protein MOV08_24075 [Streptomyces yunnanensis]
MSGTVGAGPRDGAGGHGEVEALLRAKLRAADEEIETPGGLWERVREPAADGRATAPAPGGGAAVAWLSRRRPYAVVLGVAAAVAVVVLGVWWVLLRPGAVDVRPAGPPRTVPLTVYNSEAACRTPHTLECALRLAKDPHRPYAARGNSAGRVWHGEVLAARCVVTDGQLVRDEEGITSSRWYRVRTGEGAQGWLPGVRTRNTREVPECPADGG